MTSSLIDLLWWYWSVHQNVYLIPKSFTWLTYTCEQGIIINFPKMKILIHHTIQLAWFPSFYPTEILVMRIFPYLVNLDTTTNERIKFIFQLFLEIYTHQFSISATARTYKIKQNFIYLSNAEKTFLTMQL